MVCTCPITVILYTVLTSLLTEKVSLIPTVYGRYHKHSDQEWSRLGAQGTNKGLSVGKTKYSLILKLVVHKKYHCGLIG